MRSTVCTAACHAIRRTSDTVSRPCIAPEPHVLLFRRAKNFDSHQAAQQVQYDGPVPNKAAGAAKNGRKK